MSKIHKTAIIGDNCIIGNNVEIGAYSIIEDQIKIDIYNEKGFVKNFKLDLYPNKSIQLSSDQIKNKKDQNYDEKSNFYWYLAKSSRQDLTAFSFHYNKISGDGSGEHSF